MRNTNFGRIIFIITRTRVDDVDFGNCTCFCSRNLDLKVLTCTRNHLICRRKFLRITKTRLGDINSLNTSNNLHTESFVGFIEDRVAGNNDLVSDTQFVLIGSCDTTIWEVIVNVTGITRDCQTLNSIDFCRCTKTLSVFIVEVQFIVDLVRNTRVFNNKSINLSILKLGSCLNVNVNFRTSGNSRIVVKDFQDRFFSNLIGNGVFTIVDQTITVKVFNFKDKIKTIFCDQSISLLVGLTINVNIHIFIWITEANHICRNICLHCILTKVPGIWLGIQLRTTNVREHGVTEVRCINRDEICVNTFWILWSLTETTIVLV